MSKRSISSVALLLIGLLMGMTIGPLNITASLAQGDCKTFPETGKQVCGRLLDYWTKNGGLAQQGLPLTNEFTEVSDLNGQSYTVQYFERAVFEKHPENAAPYDVLLSQLGTFRMAAKYPGGDPSGGQTPPPVPPAGGIVGQKLTVTDFSGVTFDVEVMDVQELATIPASSPWDAATAAGKFVLVKFKAINTGNESGSPSTYNMRLKDNKGRFFDGTSDINAALDGAAYLGGKSVGTTVQPGLTETIVFVYDVAPDATGYLLVVR